MVCLLIPPHHWSWLEKRPMEQCPMLQWKILHYLGRGWHQSQFQGSFGVGFHKPCFRFRYWEDQRKIQQWAEVYYRCQSYLEWDYPKDRWGLQWISRKIQDTYYKDTTYVKATKNISNNALGRESVITNNARPVFSNHKNCSLGKHWAKLLNSKF